MSRDIFELQSIISGQFLNQTYAFKQIIAINSEHKLQEFSRNGYKISYKIVYID